MAGASCLLAVIFELMTAWLKFGKAFSFNNLGVLYCPSQNEEAKFSCLHARK
jgi:hypothetical protein